MSSKGMDVDQTGLEGSRREMEGPPEGRLRKELVAAGTNRTVPRVVGRSMWLSLPASPYCALLAHRAEGIELWG